MPWEFPYVRSRNKKLKFQIKRCYKNLHLTLMTKCHKTSLLTGCSMTYCKLYKLNLLMLTKRKII